MTNNLEAPCFLKVMIMGREINVQQTSKHLHGACEPKLLHFSTSFCCGLAVTNKDNNN